MALDTFDVRSVSTDAVAQAIREILAAEPGREEIRPGRKRWMHETQSYEDGPDEVIVHTGWIMGSTLSHAVQKRLGLDIPWPGNERFHAKVMRVANALAEERQIVKLGKGEKHPLPNGSETYGRRNEADFISIDGFAQVRTQHDAAKAAWQRQARANDEREQKLNGWIMEHGLAVEPVLKLSHYTDGDEVTLPADVVEQLLIKLGGAE